MFSQALHCTYSVVLSKVHELFFTVLFYIIDLLLFVIFNIFDTLVLYIIFICNRGKATLRWPLVLVLDETFVFSCVKIISLQNR